MPYSKYFQRNHLNDMSRKSSVSSLSSDSSSDSDNAPKLLYGFGGQRYEYEQEVDDEYIYIDHLNNALGITLENLVSNGKITDIKNGIVVTPLHIGELKKLLSRKFLLKKQRDFYKAGQIILKITLRVFQFLKG